MLHPSTTLGLGNGVLHRDDVQRGSEQASVQEQVSIQETRSLFQKALLKLSLEQNGFATGDELSRTGPRSSQGNGSSNREQAYFDGALKGFEKLVRTASGAGIPLFALHQPFIDTELRRRMAMQSQGSTEEVSENPFQNPSQNLVQQEVSPQRGLCSQEPNIRFQKEDDAKLTRCLEGRRFPAAQDGVFTREGAFTRSAVSPKGSGGNCDGVESQGEPGERFNGGYGNQSGSDRGQGGFRNDSGSDWESSKGNSPTWASSEEWQGKSFGGRSENRRKTVNGRENGNGREKSVNGRENKRVLEGLAKCRLEDSEKGDAHAAKVGSNGSGGASPRRNHRDSSPSETCEQHASSMRWRGGTAGGDDVSGGGGDVTNPGDDISGDVSDRGGDVSSEGSSRKRKAREEEGAGAVGDGPETPPRPASPSRTSSGEFQRLKGGAGAGKEENGGNGSNESTVQSGHKRKQADSESYESVRQPGDEKRRDLYPARYHTDSRYPGVVRVREPKEVRDETTGDWKRIADGLRTVYECRFCRKRFLVSQALGGHMNKHREERERERARSKKLEDAIQIPDIPAHPESQHQTATTPTSKGASIRSPSTPLNLSDPWSTQSTPNPGPLPPAVLPLTATPPFQHPKRKSPPIDPLPARADPRAAAQPPPDPRAGLTYEAGFEAGFGAGLVALARAGLLVPDAAMALGWQDMSGWGDRADPAAAAAASAAADLAPMEQQLFPLDPPLLGSPPNKRLAAAAAAVPNLEKFVLERPRDEPSVAGPLVAPQPLDVKPLELDNVGELGAEGGAGMGAKGSPIWVDTSRGTEQVFQVERVQGLDKGLYALKPLGGAAPSGASLYPSHDVGFSGGRPERHTDPLISFVSAQRTRPETAGFGSRNGIVTDAVNPGGFGVYERRRSLASSQNAHPLMPRGTMSAAVRPTVGYVDKYLPQGFRAAIPESARFRLEGFQQTAFQHTQFGVVTKPRLSPRSDGPVPLSGTTGTTSSNGTAVSTDEKPYVTPTREDSLVSRGVSPGLSSPPSLSLARDPSDIYQEILQSQPSGFSKELGDASLGGSFDEQLCSFAQDHPDWPDYFQGGSVNSGDAFGAPGDKAAS